MSICESTQLIDKFAESDLKNCHFEMEVFQKLGEPLVFALRAEGSPDVFDWG
jgi:hypothetical protein